MSETKMTEKEKLEKLGHSFGMRRYRTKPEEVTAVQFTGDNFQAISEQLSLYPIEIVHRYNGDGDFENIMRIQDHEVHHGDYIIIDEYRHMKVMSWRAFEAAYEPLSTPAEECNLAYAKNKEGYEEFLHKGETPWAKEA